MSRYRLRLFFVLTYAISWAIWIPMALASFGIGILVGAVLNIVATAGPSIAAFALASLLGGGQLRELIAGDSPSRGCPCGRPRSRSDCRWR